MKKGECISKLLHDSRRLRLGESAVVDEAVEYFATFDKFHDHVEVLGAARRGSGTAKEGGAAGRVCYQRACICNSEARREGGKGGESGLWSCETRTIAQRKDGGAEQG